MDVILYFIAYLVIFTAANLVIIPIAIIIAIFREGKFGTNFENIRSKALKPIRYMFEEIF